MQRTRLVHDEEECELALFHERLDEGMAHPRGDVPIDCPEVVALLVGADLGELDTLAPKDGAVLAREQCIDQAAGAELDPLHMPKHFRRDGPPAHPVGGSPAPPPLLAVECHGTPTASRIFAMTWSAFISSASASNVSSTR